jgi:signal transduction histidine kinase
LVWQLRPEGSFNEMSKSTNLRGQLTVAGSPRRLNRDTEISLFRVAEEALRNVRLHAEARRFSVQLLYDTGVRLTVTDDGKGFDMPSYGSLAREQRMGLLGMHHRAALAGGSCRIVSQPGKGTCIEVQVPADPGPPAARTTIDRLTFPLNAASELAG